MIEKGSNQNTFDARIVSVSSLGDLLAGVDPSKQGLAKTAIEASIFAGAPHVLTPASLRKSSGHDGFFSRGEIFEKFGFNVYDPFDIAGVGGVPGRYSPGTVEKMLERKFWGNYNGRGNASPPLAVLNKGCLEDDLFLPFDQLMKIVVPNNTNLSHFIKRLKDIFGIDPRNLFPRVILKGSQTVTVVPGELVGLVKKELDRTRRKRLLPFKDHPFSADEVGLARHLLLKKMGEKMTSKAAYQEYSSELWKLVEKGKQVLQVYGPSAYVKKSQKEAVLSALAAREVIAEANMRLAEVMAKRFANSLGLPQGSMIAEELVQEACGCMSQAIDSYDPKSGLFSTFAGRVIINKIIVSYRGLVGGSIGVSYNRTNRAGKLDTLIDQFTKKYAVLPTEEEIILLGATLGFSQQVTLAVFEALNSIKADFQIQSISELDTEVVTGEEKEKVRHQSLEDFREWIQAFSRGAINEADIRILYFRNLGYSGNQIADILHHSGLTMTRLCRAAISRRAKIAEEVLSQVAKQLEGDD